MTENEKLIVKTIREDRKAYRDTVLPLNLSHIAMNNIIAKEAWEEAFSRLQAENATLRERLGKWAVDNEIVMEPRVKDGQTYYVISRKERRIVTHYICTELTPEAALARLAELKGEEK